MGLIRSIWPTPFNIKKGNVVSFIIQLVIFLVVVAVVGWLFSILSGIPIVGIIFGILGSLLGIYSLVGVILCILCFLGLCK
ncbi:MAG: hypothetical protein MJ124_07360 [Lachnospiraceae bacterium]|nr:hypothetical protein [Lachnospiraceae bacterium]